MGTAGISVDEFQALEQKVLQTVELIKREREGRTAAEAGKAAAEAHTAEVHAELAAAQEEIAKLKQELVVAGEAQGEIASLKSDAESLLREREAVRQRVEKMLASIDEII
jgi:chromosome segregation ATPase